MGFVPGRSCITQLLTVLRDWTNGLALGEIIDVIYTYFSKAFDRRLDLFINCLAQVPFEGVLVEVYKGTRRKHNMRFRQIGHTTSQYGQTFFH